MTDERDNGMQPDLYDDDRLLACALGLEEDPELQAAAAADAALGARLEAMRADVGAIGAQVSAAVPEPEESYTDLSGDRWGGLKEYFDAPAEAKPRRERRWWRVVAPVAALVVLALLVGIIAVNGGVGGSSGSSSGSSASVAQSTEQGAAPVQGFSGTGVTKGSDVDSSRKSTIGERFRDQLDRFAVVVLARARQVSGAVQRFAVLRVFKGQAPKMIELAVNGQPTDVGRLHLLMLEPTAAPDAQDETPWPLESPLSATESPLPVTVSPAPTESPLPATVSPEPIPSLAAADGPGEQLAVSYTYLGEPTVVRELAPGTDPSTVDITFP
jgi:hypothetical protein